MPELSVETRSLASLLADKSLTIPYYQRPYTWTDKQVEPLLTDLFKADKGKPVIMGSIILHRTHKNLNEIVDGQQRLTTFAILSLLLKRDPDGGLLDFKFTNE